MSRYGSRSYDTGGSRRFESSLRSYDTGSSYKSYDSGRRFETGRTYDSGKSYDSGRSYGTSGSTSTTSSRYASPTSSSRSYTSGTPSSYSPTSTRSYSSSYSSRNGSSETGSRLTRTNSSSKPSDGTSSPTTESRYSRSGYTSPRSSIPTRSSELANGRSPRSSLSSEPSLESREDSLTRNTEGRRSQRNRDKKSDSDDNKDEIPSYRRYSRSYLDTKTEGDKDDKKDDTRTYSRYGRTYHDSKTEIDSDKDKEDRSVSRYSRRHRDTDTDISETKPRYESKYDTGSDTTEAILKRAERRRLRAEAKKDLAATDDCGTKDDSSNTTREGEKTDTKEDALTEWRRMRALGQGSLSSDLSLDKPDATDRLSRRDRTGSLKDSTDDSDTFVRQSSYRRRHNISEEKDTDFSTKEESSTPTRSFRRFQRENQSEEKEDVNEKIREKSEERASRAERIAKYKEERRKELAAISNLTKQLDSDSEGSGVVARPSLFLAASSQRQSSEERSEDGKGATSSHADGQTHRRRLPEIPSFRQDISGADISVGGVASKTKPEVVSSDSGISENEARFRKDTSLNAKLGVSATVKRSSSLREDKSLAETTKQSSSRSRDETRNKSRSRDRLDVDRTASNRHSSGDNRSSEDEGSKLDVKSRSISEKTLISTSKSVRRSQSDVTRTSHSDPNLESLGSETLLASSALDQLKLKQIARRGELLEKKTFGAKDRSADYQKSSEKAGTEKSEKTTASKTLSPLKTPTKIVGGERMPLSPDPLDDLLKKNAAFLSDVDMESEIGSSSSNASKSFKNDKPRKSLRRRHLQKSMSKKSSVDEDGKEETAKRLSKEVDATEEGAAADDKFSSVTSAVRKQTHNSSDNLQGENNNLELQVTDILDEFESSGGSESSDTQMRKSALGLRRSEFDTRHVDDYTNRDRSEKRRRFITRNAQAVKDSDSLPGSTESESMFETAPSAPSSTEPVRRKVRKDKSALRKSCLNRHEDDNSSKLGSVDSSSDRGQDKGPSSISISHIGREEGKKRVNATTSEDSRTHLTRPLSQKKDISSLIQRFSNSDASSSEKSDTETNISRRRVLPIRRQDPVVISSSPSDESNTESSRRTPERTHSLRIHGSTETTDSKVQRTSSFKSDFMRRRFSGDTDKPTPELADVLGKRSNIVEKQEEEDRVRSAAKATSKYEKADTWKAAEVEEVIADNEVAAVLKARRKQTDSLSDNETKEQDNKSCTSSNISETKTSLKTLDSTLALLNRVTEELDSPAALSSDSEILAPVLLVSQRKRSSKESISEAEQLIKSVESSITSRTSVPISGTSVTKGDNSKEQNVSGLTTSDYTTECKTRGCSDNVGDTGDVSVTHTSHRHAAKRDSEKADFAMPLDEKWVTDRKRKDKHDPNSISPSKSYHDDTDTGKTNGDIIGKTEGLTEDTEIMDSAKKPGKELDPITSRSVDSLRTDTWHETSSDRYSSSNLRRAESLKDTSIKRTDSLERRKGILKRTPSLPKQPTRPIVDPELAERLRRQREKENDLSDEDEHKPNRMSIIEDIQEIEWREKKAEGSDGDSDGDGGVKLSVFERISKMENKLEEEKFGSARSRSGFTTPKSAQKTWMEKSRSESSFDSGSSHRLVSGEQLMEKLNVLAEQTDVLDLAANKPVSERRQQFQRRNRDDWRTRTQPITIEEIHAADNLETVSAFRSLIRKKTTINAYNQMRDLNKKISPVGKKCEFPQHISPEKSKRRTRSQRHKTTPVTAAELSAIPEGETMEGDRSKMGHGNRDSTTDSGILSDADSLLGRNSSENLRSLTLEMDLNEDDPARGSVSAKMSMFKAIEERSKAEKEKAKSASGAKRYIDRKKRERSRTQPVTEDEVKTAAEISDPAEEKKPEVNIPRPRVISRAKSVEPEESCVAEEDELVGLSLAEKVKLFTQKKEEKSPARTDAPVPRRRARKNISRYSTQPVTIEEVEKAASLNRVSPLAASLIKPPDPEILKSLPISAQRELMAQHAEACLSQPNSRPGSRPSSKPGSRRGSSHDLEDETSENLQGVRSILKQESGQLSPEADVKGILKSEKNKKETEPRGILKRGEISDTNSKQCDSETHSILKQSELVSKTNEDSEPRSSLKQTESESVADAIDPNRGILRASDSRLECEPKGILKGELSDGLDVKGVLKKELKGDKSVTEPRGILKKEGSFEIRKSEPEKSVLKSLDSKDDRDHNLRSILKKEPSKENVGVETGSNDGTQAHLGEDDDQEVSEAVEDHINRRRPRQGDRYLTQPADFTPEKSPQSRRKFKYEGRHLTQPITPEEMKEAKAAATPSPVKPGGSIGDRLNALKKSGEEDWRRRVPKTLDLDTPVKLRDKTNLAGVERPSSLADRLKNLDESKGGWKERVEEKDQEQFTVKGRLGRGGSKESPLVARLRQTPKRDGDPSSNGPSPVTSPTSPSKEFAVVTKKISLPKEIISGPAPVKTEREKHVEEEEKKEPVRVAVPQMDTEAIDSFFQTRDISQIKDKVDVDIDDFNEIFMKANEMLPAVKKARPARSKSTRSRNHLKTRSLHLELKDEYLEISHGVAEKEFKRMKKETISKEAGFAQEALAGLASKENFSKVALRKAESSTPGGTGSFQPYKPLMLLHVKGRYKIQTRLVEPSAASINSGDCYLLVTRDKIINWIGEYCNVIEKARSADIAGFIQQKKDLGCKAAALVILEEHKGHLGAGRHFWNAINGYKEYQDCGPEDEDELYESHIIKTTMVYQVVDNSLMPYEEYWGMQPKYEMLKKDEVLVFDFGTEMYVWQGKTVTMEKRKQGIKLAQKLWEKGYDYEECAINPLCPLHDDDSAVPKKSSERPSWALFGKVNQNMETILFREKFADWPDSSRLIKVKDTQPSKQKADVVELQPYDAKLMLAEKKNPVTLLLEGSHVGRGTKWYEDMEGFIREVDILTLGTSVWHVLEYDHYKMPETSYGQFHEGDTYVVRWQYMIANAGMRTLKGHAARHSLTGRERCAYFFWQGKGSTINEQGASALMTVELDEERGPQIRVVQGKELPCFLNLFEGRMMVHVGKREDASTNTQGSWRFFCVRGEYTNEMCLVEIPLCTDNLRSRSSFILLSVKTGLVYIWHGAKSPQHTRKIAVKAVDNLKEKCPLEVNMDSRASLLVTEVEEGSEKSDFWGPLGGRPKDSYISLIKDPQVYQHTVRLFYMCSVSGVFKVSEVLYEARSNDLVSPFPFLQADLYNESVSQPALFLVDNDHEVYLWQGWWPVGDEEQENVATGSARARFDTDRRCAMLTTIQYCEEKNSAKPPTAYLVCAGVEPKSFTNLFPYWEVDETVKEVAKDDGKEDDYCDLLSDVLARFSKTEYSLEELLDRPLPEGVDPSKLEWYLEEDKFQEIFEMSKEEFYKLPNWKQRQVKQPTGLF
ncbi:supervillin-like isoform X3 [Haliotis rufescens]|uniref:supervillin-like isoform X3 n=1 Tax=Haliotis rufescens TaxID=6454 RepID=UPI00201EF2EA|nr:supervillin-like isoform X3 [Haliotis rufescens]